MRTLSFILALVGLAVSIALVGWYGFGGVVAAVASAGWGGFAIIVAWQLLLFCVLGLAWDAIIPPRAAAPALGADLGPHGARRLGQLPALLAGRRLRVRRPRGDAARHFLAARHRLHRGGRHRGVPRRACLHRHRPRHPAGPRPPLQPGGAGRGRARAGGHGLLRLRLAATGGGAAVRPPRAGASPAAGSPTPTTGCRCCRPSSA